jgi:hypothetical protein
MGLPVEAVRLTFEEEFEKSRRRAELLGFELTGDVDLLKIRATFTALDGQKFILLGEFDDYKMQPPWLEFEEPDTGNVGTKRAYPKSKDSFFHGHPCICAPFSRKAYKDVHKSDWTFAGWTTAVVSNFNWAQYSTMPAMLVLVHTRLTDPEYHVPGRME